MYFHYIHLATKARICYKSYNNKYIGDETQNYDSKEWFLNVAGKFSDTKTFTGQNFCDENLILSLGQFSMTHILVTKVNL